jgi:hypothetical protein
MKRIKDMLFGIKSVQIISAESWREIISEHEEKDSLPNGFVSEDVISNEVALRMLSGIKTYKGDWDSVKQMKIHRVSRNDIFLVKLSEYYSTGGFRLCFLYVNYEDGKRLVYIATPNIDINTGYAKEYKLGSNII